jgi:cytochrome b subunit of formate dehydrogenase
MRNLAKQCRRVLGLMVLGGGLWAGAAVAAEAPAGLDNKACLGCHQADKHKIEVPAADGEKRTLPAINPKTFGAGVHAELQCVDCHANIVDAKENHQKDASRPAPDCATCHQKQWEEARQPGMGQKVGRLGVVVSNIEAYKQSFHARPDADHPERAKAGCNDCHSAHDFAVPKAGTPEREQYRLTTLQVCGKCHEDQLDEYKESIHGQTTLGKGDPKAAVCIDCHTTHEVKGASSDAFKLNTVDVCGGCHKNELHSYFDTYHGQVTRLGYTYTAKCSNCHGSHGIKGPDDPKSKVHIDNRLKTCQQCHDGKKGLGLATAGFVTFGVHANSHDYDKYPQVWIATKSMAALLIGVFVFFWTHCILWYYREWKERKEGKTVAHVKTAELGIPQKHFQRFAWGWRLAHLAFAVIMFVLILTGITALYPATTWAPKVAAALGGPHGMGVIHRICAALFIGIFVIHFLYVAQKLLRDRSFRWFGPDSLVPNWKDLADIWHMFKWFVGKGEKPKFDRWTYYEKFDYWAVFWGVNIIGWSGLMLALPEVTARYLPGWVFNIATMVHGEEAFMAAVFLFTVHFINNHLRPEKMPPPDVVMFTGTQSLEEFQREHPAQYQRLVDSGELEKYLVDAPSRPMHVVSVILGLALMAIGFALLVLVGVGFFSHL